MFPALTIVAPRKTRDSLERDLRMLSEALADYEAGVMAAFDASEQALIAETIRQRIADLNARIAKFGKA
jgi:hypothetical protein